MEEAIKTLLPLGTNRTFKKGSVLLYQGEAPRMAYVIKSGDVKVYTITNAGEEKIVTMHGANDIFPSPWVYKKSTTSLYYYETTSPCEIITVPRDVLLTHFAKPEHMASLVDYLSTNYVGMLMRTTALQQSRATEKIMFTLYYLLFRYGQEVKPHHFKIVLPLTHNTIASLVGLTRETTTTGLSSLRRQGVLSYSRHIYVINKPKLERLLGEESFETITL